MEATQQHFHYKEPCQSTKEFAKEFAIREKANNIKMIVGTIAKDWETILIHLEHFNQLQTMLEKPLTITQCIHFIVNSDIMNDEITKRPIKRQRTNKHLPTNKTSDRKKATHVKGSVTALTKILPKSSLPPLPKPTPPLHNKQWIWKQTNLSVDEMIHHLQNHYTIFKTLPTNNAILMDFYYWCQHILLTKMNSQINNTTDANTNLDTNAMKILSISKTIHELVEIEKYCYTDKND